MAGESGNRFFAGPRALRRAPAAGPARLGGIRCEKIANRHEKPLEYDRDSPYITACPISHVPVAACRLASNPVPGAAEGQGVKPGLRRDTPAATGPGQEARKFRQGNRQPETINRRTSLSSGERGLKQRRSGLFWSLPGLHRPGLLKRQLLLPAVRFGIPVPIHGTNRRSWGPRPGSAAQSAVSALARSRPSASVRPRGRGSRFPACRSAEAARLRTGRVKAAFPWSPCQAVSGTKASLPRRSVIRGAFKGATPSPSRCATEKSPEFGDNRGTYRGTRP